MDSAFADKAFADQIGVTFPLLSDWGGEVTRSMEFTWIKYKAARRVNFLIGKRWEDFWKSKWIKDAIDPTKIVDTCERPKLKN